MHFSVGIIAALVAAASATASPVDVAEKRDVGVIKFFSQRNFGGFEHSQQAQFGVCVNLPNEISGDCASVKVPDDAEECTFYRADGCDGIHQTTSGDIPVFRNLLLRNHVNSYKCKKA